MNASYDAIVIGARCAGSPTAMLLARQGQRVLLVDKAQFPSDTMSTHLVHPPGLTALARWGLLESLAASGCPPLEAVTRSTSDRFTITGSPATHRRHWARVLSSAAPSSTSCSSMPRSRREWSCVKSFTRR